MPVLFWTICHRRTRQARMKTQKIIVLTVEFTKKPLSTASHSRERTIRGETLRFTGNVLCSCCLLDDSNLPMYSKRLRGYWMRRINRTRTTPVSFFNILLRRSCERLRNRYGFCPKLCPLGYCSQVTAVNRNPG